MDSSAAPLLEKHHVIIETYSHRC